MCGVHRGTAVVTDPLYVSFAMRRAFLLKTEDGGGRPGTTRVMSHDFSLAGTEGSAWTIVPYSSSSLYPPGRSPS